MKTITFVFFAALVAYPSLGSAEKGPNIVERLVAVGVDPSTIDQLKEDILNSQEAAIDLKARLHKERLNLRRLMDQDSPEEREVMSQVESVGAAEIALRKNQVAMMLKVRAVLTPEQRIQMEAMGKRGRHHRGERGDRGERGERREGRRGPGGR
ncbi:MAG: periplasmic heavy metal sensor [Myxococcota bacterium]